MISNTIVLFSWNDLYGITCITEIKRFIIVVIKLNIFYQNSYIHIKLQESSKVNIWQIKSNDKLIDLFTKILCIAIFKKLIYGNIQETHTQN